MSEKICVAIVYRVRGDDAIQYDRLLSRVRAGLGQTTGQERIDTIGERRGEERRGAERSGSVLNSILPPKETRRHKKKYCSLANREYRLAGAGSAGCRC